MKPIISYQIIALCTATLLSISCKKDESKGLITSIKSNHPPIAHAGKDSTIYFPFNDYNLDGSLSTDQDMNIEAFWWKLLQGPSIVKIEQPERAKTFIKGFVKTGIYTFELTVTDAYKLVSRDTVNISVEPMICNGVTTEVILKDVSWDYSWIQEIDLSNFLQLGPPNSHFKNIYIKRDGSSEWELVVKLNEQSPDYQYHTWVYGNNEFDIYPSDNNMSHDTPDIKIEFCQ